MPSNVCRECGLAANTLTCLIKFGQLPTKPCFDVSTFHKGTCDSCGRTAHVTEARDYFYPDFTLLSGNFKRKLKKERE